MVFLVLKGFLRFGIYVNMLGFSMRWVKKEIERFSRMVVYVD